MGRSEVVSARKETGLAYKFGPLRPGWLRYRAAGLGRASCRINTSRRSAWKGKVDGLGEEAIFALATKIEMRERISKSRGITYREHTKTVMLG